ncbi:MAG TPA: hypothetical protein VM942_02300 [Acidimicrobiales bacterium]|nr:hypothetical protein [Acidimicrobiales bacterium]
MTNEDMTDKTRDAEDEILLQELREVVNRIDPVPPETIAAARSSFMWRTIDAELAQLAHDSVLDGELALTRGVVAPALLTFESSGLTVEIETLSADDGWTLHGQLVPAQPGLVEIRHPGGVTSVAADDMGRFAADGLQSGPVSLRCRAGESAVATDWFLA